MCKHCRYLSGWIWIFLVVALHANPWPALAEENVIDMVRRNDGVVIAVVETPQDSLDWLLGIDPTRIEFRKPDRTVIAATDFAVNVLARKNGNGWDIYQYKSKWIPVADRVNHFDGYLLTPVSPGSRWSSLLLHIKTYLPSYILALGLGVFLLVTHRLWKSISEKETFIVLAKISGKLVYGLVVLVYIITIWTSKISPLLLFVFAGMIVAVYFLLLKIRYRVKTTEARSLV